ncbi:MAG: carbamoyltransferase HypF, partial [Synergistota bacterium]|nr:carbamoyltransferase HypF [Synergistota bacterium]
MLYKTRIVVSGIVQGVGFRPFCARLARSEGISGFALNTSAGVEMELHGEGGSLDRFLSRISLENPPASAVYKVEVIDERHPSPRPPAGFEIHESRREARNTAMIPADLSTCSDCLSEMKDPSNRRYRYPFINCTNCGPRYSIISELPYDRPTTTMSEFKMCPECHGEYSDPLNRRFHAEPNACPVCGPLVWLADSRGSVLEHEDRAVRLASSLLGEGKILAVKGIGGFHLACSPFSDETVALLRSRKKREHKPFAVMVSSLRTAERLAYVPDIAKKLLLSPAAPIVLCCARRREEGGVSRFVAPGQRTLGLMLPYTPLHHLLLEEIDALVMTSANFSDAPIVSDNEIALRSLAPIVDFFLLSDRDIRMPIDDSVAAPLGRSFFLMRRGRGYTPLPITFPGKDDSVILGTGAEMKGGFCFSRAGRLIPGQYLGDMKQRETLAYYNRSLEHFMRLYELKPEVVAYDMHPRYLSSRIAERLAVDHGAETVAVQHHHAHFAACLFENGVDGEAMGLIFDGTGYGEDGGAWGGEIFVGDISRYERAGHFLPSRLPGGDAAILEPWRYAVGLLHDVYGKEEALSIGREIWGSRSMKVEILLETLPFSPPTTSCGRLFDAAAALLGLCDVASYDGQAAMSLEAAATGTLEAPFKVDRAGGLFIIDWRPVIRWIVESKNRLPLSEIAGGVHAGLAKAVAGICRAIRD